MTMAVEVPASTTAPQEIRETVDAVLSRPAFQGAEPSLLDRALQWLGEQVSRLVAVAVGSDAGQVVFSAVLAVVVLGLLGAAVVFALRLRRDRTAPHAAVVGPTGVGAAQWAARAARAEAEGDLRASLRCRYRALVATLAEHGLVEEIPGRTAGQYLEAVRGRVPEAAGPFGVATAAFERAWYGHVPVGPAELDAVREAVDATRAAVGRATRPRPAGRAPAGVR